MIVFPVCKINLGLNIIARRSDGFHDISTVFYPISWCDALEVIETSQKAGSFTLTQSGIPVDGDYTTNLIYKCYQLITATKRLPPILVHLHKNIPMGAGLGGGSSDAAYFLQLIDRMFELRLSREEKTGILSQLGSDCAFFIDATPCIASGKGDQLLPISVDLSSYFILVVYPGLHSNTASAYAGITPAVPEKNLAELIREPVTNWKQTITNDFEPVIFRIFPQVQQLKEELYALGAIYAAMSGSGSAVFGIFKSVPDYRGSYRHYLQKPADLNFVSP